MSSVVNKMWPITTLFVLFGVYAAYGHNIERINTSEVDINDISPNDGSIFRRDYTFFPSVNGWMKLHIFPEQWTNAHFICAVEGARLASPINKDMQVQMKALLQTLQNKNAYTGITTISTGNDFFSVEGVPVSNMSVTWAPGEPDNKLGTERCLTMTQEGELMNTGCEGAAPYMCYREKVGVMTLNECGTYDKQYVRDKRTGSCYKVHETKTPWRVAHTICSAEGAHLAIINSEREAQVLANLNNEHRIDDWTFIGFHKWAGYLDNSRWYTLDGKTLKEAGFARWAPGEPNAPDGRDLCGSFKTKNGENYGLNDSNCDDKLPFICEIDDNFMIKLKGFLFNK